MPKALRFIVLFAVSHPARLRPGPRPGGLSQQAGADDRAVPAGRPGRPDRATGWRRSCPKSSANSSTSRTTPAPAAIIGVGVGARAPADGYSLIVNSQVTVINRSLYKSLPYDPVKDFIAGHAHRDHAERRWSCIRRCRPRP